VDNFQPTVVSVSPANVAANVPVDTSVTVTFSEPMKPVSINFSTFYVKRGLDVIKGTMSLESGNTTATFTPEYPLFAGASYSVSVTTGVKDITGNQIVILLK
jgi:hypothetical protein